jgi:lipid-A-disaccharide synthase
MSFDHRNKVFILAGETSGDFIGSYIMKGLKVIDESTIFFGVGGSLMLKEGLSCHYNINEFNIIGFLNSIKNYRKLKYYVDEITKLILIEKPKVIITIDTKGFSYVLAKNIRSSFKLTGFKCPLIHFVPPTIWAYGEYRAKKWKNLHDGLFCMFKKEEQIFYKLDIQCSYLGNPLIEKVLKTRVYKHTKKIKQNSKNFKCLLLPGSRDSEIKYILPVYISLIKNHKLKQKVEWIIPTTKFHFDEVTKKIKNLSCKNIVNVVVLEENYELLKNADIAIACSGTITLELVLLRIPTIAVYKTDILSAFLGKLMVNFKNVILPNFLLGEPSIPFLFQGNCTSYNIEKVFNEYINDIQNQRYLFNIYAKKIIKSMNYENETKFNFLNNSSAKIMKIIKNFNY